MFIDKHTQQTLKAIKATDGGVVFKVIETGAEIYYSNAQIAELIRHA